MISLHFINSHVQHQPASKIQTCQMFPVKTLIPILFLIHSSLFFSTTFANAEINTFNRATFEEHATPPEGICEKRYLLQLTLDVCSHRVSIEHPESSIATSCQAIVALHSCQAEYICRKCSGEGSPLSSLAELQIRFQLLERLKAAGGNCSAELKHFSSVQTLCKSRLPVFIVIAVIFGISAAITAFLVYFYAQKMSVEATLPTTTFSALATVSNFDSSIKSV